MSATERQMAGRIRWTGQSDGGQLGHVGTIERCLFMLIPPFLGRWELQSTLPGWDRALLRGEVAELKGHAEQWLEEFTSSLGAIFPPESDEPAEASYEQRYGPGVAT